MDVSAGIINSGQVDLERGRLPHKNILKMGLVLALSAFQDQLIGYSLMLMLDNSTVAAYLNQQGRKVSLQLCLLMQQNLLGCSSTWFRYP